MVAENEQKKIIIFADNRETKSAVVEELSHYDCIVKEKLLHVADFLLSDRVAVERKSYSDFLQSIVDGRLFSQVKDLCDNFERPLLLIEKSNNCFLQKRNIHPNAIRGALAAIAIDFSMPLLWSDSPQETAALLFTIAKREQLGEKREVAIRGKKKAESLVEQQLYLIAGLPSVSSVLAKRLLSCFRKPEKVFSASAEELQQVDGLGKEKAKRIRELLEKEYNC